MLKPLDQPLFSRKELFECCHVSPFALALKPAATHCFEYRLAQEAINLRKQAEGMPDSIRRDELLRKASQIDILNWWLTSPGLQAPEYLQS